jgi:hypothetical protein
VKEWRQTFDPNGKRNENAATTNEAHVRAGHYFAGRWVNVPKTFIIIEDRDISKLEERNNLQRHSIFLILKDKTENDTEKSIFAQHTSEQNKTPKGDADATFHSNQ